MTDDEKLQLARWLAERLEPEPEWDDDDNGVLSTGGLWICLTTRSPKYPARLDGNFAAAVIEWFTAKAPSGEYSHKEWTGSNDFLYTLWLGYWQTDVLKAVAGASENSFVEAVCLAAKAALEGGGE